MNFESPILKTISTAADVITLIGVITAIGLFKKRNHNLLAFKISMLLQYMLRFAIIIIGTTLIFYITAFLYSFILPIFKGDWGKDLYWEKDKEIQHLLAYVLSACIGLPIFWIYSTIVWTSSFRQTKIFLNHFLPKGTLSTEKEYALEIISATYGSKRIIDVTQLLREMVLNNSLTVTASNELAGDPDVGVRKKMIIMYKVGGKQYQKQVEEGYSITIPSTTEKTGHEI